MPNENQAMSIKFAEGAVTKLRREWKLLVSHEEALELCQKLAVELNAPSPAQTQITSVYFDRPGQLLATRALLTPHDCLKVRTKEYFPDLGEAAEDRVVLEVKRERNGMTQKRRVWVPRSQLSQAVKGPVASRILPLIAGGRLLPVLAVSYVRQVYQLSDAWRVTVDRSVEFYPVNSELALSTTRLTAARLGEPVARENLAVVEVKHLGAGLPFWLACLASRQSARFSKFAVGMSRLYSLQANQTEGGERSCSLTSKE
jgi:hypothetical protein